LGHVTQDPQWGSTNCNHSLWGSNPGQIPRGYSVLNTVDLKTGRREVLKITGTWGKTEMISLSSRT
jgi:hypothetical protein